MLTPPSHQTERNDMSDRKSPKDKGSGQAPQPKTGAVTPVPLCRYEELALRENHLRHAASRLNEK
ncbi:hypothetical protein CDQ91_16120 [Sphingopyxis witflariensis]|uniref:Uncharacterized protein n=2 Tax=Sphingopyxis witflariensis TaxID=173675 RepID=A0A246JNG4_9SPHN|nr:hypothetical protein CDQ91_16120 [Sphingopyxis witflariensis]